MNDLADTLKSTIQEKASSISPAGTLSGTNYKVSKNNMSMTQVESNVERIQTRIDMIRQESSTLSFRMERMLEQRKQLTQEKNTLKDLLTELNVSATK